MSLSDIPLIDLWEKDPDVLTDAELDAIVMMFRNARAKWEEEENNAQRSGKRVNPRKGIKFADLKDIKL